MKNYTTVFFDLDGTLVDSGEGVRNSVEYALKKFNIEVTDKDKLSCFIGPPLTVSFKTFYGFDDEKADLGVVYYREYYKDKGIFEGYVYEGIEECLKRLKEAGKRVMVATSKPEEYAKRVLEKFGIAKYFDFIAGATMDEKTRANKIQIMQYAFDSCGVSPSDVIMVGDRCFDIEGAKNFGMECVAVLYGYGSEEEFLKYGAEYIVNSPEEVANLILCENDN
ncbi:MAG: HAD family hydrolase [Clostridia bacterium]|nr:HAD family hydrolase [Clostridia bacterium]